MTLLTEQQIEDLALIIVEECGPCLNEDELSEQIGLILEDIAGVETASDSVVHQVITDIRRHYHDACEHTEED